MKTIATRHAPRARSLPLLLFGLLGLGGLAFPQGADAQDVMLTGEWALTVESPNGAGQRQVTFVQEGDKLTGEIASSMAAGPLSGTVEGDKVTFVALVQMDSGPFEITYTGTVTGDEMTGTVQFGSYGSGTFRGHRVEPSSRTR